MEVAARETKWDFESEPKFQIHEVSCAPGDILVPFTRGRFRGKKLKFERELLRAQWEALLHF